MKSKSLKLLSLFLALMTIVSTVAACNTTAPTPDATQPSTQPTTSVTDQVTLPSTDPITDLVTDPMTFPSTDATISATESNNESKDVTSAVNTEPMDSTESITLPSTESITLPSTETITLPSTEIFTLPSTEVITASTETLTGIPTETDTETFPLWSETDSDVIDETEPPATVTETETETETEAEIITDIVIETNPIVTDTSFGDISDIVTDTVSDTITDAITESVTESATNDVIGTETDTQVESDTQAGAVSTETQPTTETTTEAPTEAPTETETETEPFEGVILYADGSFQAKVIRKELADAFGKTYYNDFRALVKSKVKAQPSIKTDFVGVNQELDNGPAVLIGETAYPESTQVYKKLKTNQAKAVVVGNKYVIAYTTEESAIELFAKLETLFKKKATSTSIIIDSDWNVSVEIKGFDESGLKQSINLPSPSGFSWATSGRDAGQGSKMYIANSVSEANYTSYCNALKSAGFALYTTNTLHTNKFSTYVTKEQIVSVMYYAPKSVLKVVVDPRSTFGLPGIKAENVYTKTNTATEFVQLGLKQISGSGENGMGYLVKLSNGKFVVVDGGFAYDSGGGGNSAKFILETMKKMQGNSNKPVIAAYIVTHIHTDHAGGFMGFANSYAKDVVIEKFIYNQPSDAQMNAVSNMGGRKNWLPNAISKLQNAGSLKSVIKAHPGMQIYLAELTITILGTIDVIEDSNHTKMKNGNDSSVVSMFEMNGGKVLLTGDCEPQEGKIIRDIYGGIGNKTSPLKADFIQVAHHGYGNTNTDYIGCDQNALNVMASGGGTAAGSSPIYALVPVGLASGQDPAGYYDAVKGMHAMRIFAEDHRLVAYNKNMTIKFNTNGSQTIEKTKHDGFWIGTWTTW